MVWDRGPQRDGFRESPKSRLSAAYASESLRAR